MNEDDRIEGLERLARSRRPEHDLWPGIATRLAPRRRSHYATLQLALAASIIAGLAAVVVLNLSPSGSPVETASVGLAPGLALAHDSRAIVQANVNLVEQAKRQLRDALRHDPDSAGLRQLLGNTERRERDLRALL